MRSQVRPHPDRDLTLQRTTDVDPPAGDAKDMLDLESCRGFHDELSLARIRRQLDRDAQFLAQFADQCVLRPLSRLDLAAGEFPETGQRPPRGALGDQQSALGIEQHAGRDNDDRALDAFVHTRIRRLR